MAAKSPPALHAPQTRVPRASAVTRPGVFRVRDGKLVEHWDVIQSVPNTTASGNDMFSTLSTPRLPWPDPRSSARASKAIATTMFTELTVGRDVTALDRHVAGPYYQHNTQLPNGTGAAKQLYSQLFTRPYYNTSSKRVIADGDLVAIHSHVTFANDPGYAVIDLFRVRHDKVVEHWDVIQPVPATSANNNTMF